MVLQERDGKVCYACPYLKLSLLEEFIETNQTSILVLDGMRKDPSVDVLPPVARDADVIPAHEEMPLDGDLLVEADEGAVGEIREL